MKNFEREKNSKDAFSLFELENQEFMNKWNYDYNDIKEKLKIKLLKNLVINPDDTETAFREIDSHVSALHIKFEDWLFEDKKYKDK